MKVTKSQLKRIIKEEQTKALIEHELRKLKRIDEGKMKDLAKRFGVPLALVTAIAAGIEAPTSVDIPAEAPGVEQTVDAPEETEEKGGLRINPETGGYEYVKYAHVVEDPPEDTGDEIDMDSLKYRHPPKKVRMVVNKESKMKVTKSQLKQIIKEELTQALCELGGMSSKDFRKMDPRAALKLIQKQDEDPDSNKTEKELSDEIATYRARMADGGQFETLEKLRDAYIARKKYYGIEDPEVKKEISDHWKSWERSPSYGGTAAGGRW